MNNKRNTSRRSRNTTVGTGRDSNRARSRATSSNSRYSASNYGSRPVEDSYSSAYSRKAYQADAAKRRKSEKRKKIALGIGAVLLIFALVGAGWAFVYLNSVSSNLHEGLDEDLQDVLVKTDLANEPFYMLLMGTDGSAERAQTEEFAGDAFRTDSIILARIDPVDVKVTLVSLHRDTYVDLGEYGPNKLNAAHFFGGPSLAVETVSELAGVPISHYAEIDFDGFKGIVDSLGGIEVDVPIDINDPEAGGSLSAGLQTLNGDQALILCRTRHSYDEYGAGDEYRAANQRLVITAIAKKLLSADIGTMASTIQTLSQYVTTDLEIMDIIGLAQSMKNLDTSTDMYTAMEPTTPAYVNDLWYEYTNVTEWKEMMSRVDQGLPPTTEDIIDESTGTVIANSGSGSIGGAADGSSSSALSGHVKVKNGSGINGAASTAAAILEKAGFTVETGNANTSDYAQTVVVYGDEGRAFEASQIAKALGGAQTYLNSDGAYNLEGDYLIVIGADWSK